MGDLQRVGAVFGASGTPSPLTATITGAQRVADAHARYFDAAVSGRLFYASMAASAALGTALTATAVTLTLYNPLNSGYYIVIHEGVVTIGTVMAAAGNSEISWAASGVPTAAAPSATTAAVNFGNCLLGGPSGIAKAYTAATLPATPVRVRGIGSIGAVGTLAGLVNDTLVDKVEGALILAPNTAVTIQNVGTAVSGTAHVIWEEVKIY